MVAEEHLEKTDIFQYVKHNLADAEADSLLRTALKDALQILEDWVATK